MTVGALFGVKAVGRYAEHIVALNADSMDHTGTARQRGIFRCVRRGRRMLSHGLILAQDSKSAQAREASISRTRETISSTRTGLSII